jgi:predicted outer membrane repeat protein
MIMVRKSRNVIISNFAFENIHSSLFLMQDTNFTEIKSMSISNLASPFTFENSIVELFSNISFNGNGNTSTSEGGAIRMFNSYLMIANSSFINNTAKSGGAIYFDCSSMMICGLSITDTTFDSNAASVKGGAIYYGFGRPQLKNVTNSNNSAPYGPNLASYAVKIKMLGNDEMVISNIGSNIKLEETIHLALLDYDDQVMVLNSVNQIIITPVDRSIASVRGVNSVLLHNGVATFDNLVAITKYGSKNVKFQASSKGIDSTKIKKVYGAEISENIVTFNFRDCMPGESIANNYSCNKCSAGSYSLQWSSSECFSCIDDAVCAGRDVIEVNPEFWRMTTNSTKIVE